MRKIALILMTVCGCGSASFEADGFSREDAGTSEDVKKDAPIAPEEDAGSAGAAGDSGSAGASGSIEHDARKPCLVEECPTPKHSIAVCVGDACDFKCPAVCTKTGDGCDCPLSEQCCNDQDCGGVSCNRGQCSGTYSKCEPDRCWAWCTYCLDNPIGGSCVAGSSPEGVCQCGLFQATI